LLVVAAVLVSALVGISRLYLGVHYASYVIAGFATRAACALLCLRYLQSFEK
jgi:undecaprenyl-diphosphatase